LVCRVWVKWVREKCAGNCKKLRKIKGFFEKVDGFLAAFDGFLELSVRKLAKISTFEAKKYAKSAKKVRSS
jgi:hypothetical protein